MTDGALRRVLRSDELPPPASNRDSPARLREQATAGTIAVPDIREVDVEGQAVLLTRLQSGEVIAFEPYCPHQGTPLRQATIFAGNVRCEQHKYVYDPRTGRNILPSQDASPKALERLRPGFLTTYEVEERDGWIWVSPRPNPPPDERTPLPADLVPSEVAGPVHAPPEERPDRPPQTVEVVAGEEFELDLATRIVPNHLWQIEVDGDAVEVRDQRLDERAAEPRYVLRAVASDAGTAILRCAYAKPWGSDIRDEYTFTIHVRET